MIVLVDKATIQNQDPCGLDFTRLRDRWLVLDPSGTLQAPNASGGERPWHDVLPGLLEKSTHTAGTVNRVLVLAETLRLGPLADVLGYIAKLPRADYDIHIGLVLTASSTADAQTSEEVAALRTLVGNDLDTRIRCVWMIGRETSDKEAISTDLREAAVGLLMQLLLQDGESCALRIGMLPDEHHEQAGRQFYAWGFRTFAPGAEFLATLTGRLLEQAARASLSQLNKTAPDLSTTMQQKAGGFLDAGLVLDLPFVDSTSGSGPARRLSEVLPEPPNSPVLQWGYQVLCAGPEASQKVEFLLRNHERSVRDYHKSLVEALRKQAASVRVRGQAILTKITMDGRSFVLGEGGLARFIVALRHFFPTFRRNSQPSLPDAPCPPEHSPPLPEVIQRLVNSPIDKAKDQCERQLLSARTRLRILLVAGGVVVLSLLLFYYSGYDWRSLIPIAVTLLGLVVVDAWNRRSFEKIRAAVNEDVEQGQAALRAQFVQKVEWVVRKTELTLRHQVAADVSAFGRLIRRKVEFLYPNWSAYTDVVHVVSDDTELTHTDGLRVASADLERVRDAIQDTAKEILSLPENRTESEWAAMMDALRGRLWRLLEPAVPDASTPLPPNILECCRVTDPPFLARYDGVFSQQPFRKLFLLPAAFPDKWAEQLMRQGAMGDQQVGTYRSTAFKGVSVLVTYPRLRLDQLHDCFG